MFFKRKLKVLLLDDDPSMQRLVSAILKREGFRVDVVLTGRQAIEAMERKKYQVILLDLMMPHEGGITVVRHLENEHVATLRRVIVLTASSDSVIETVKSSVAAVVQKPFDAAELVAVIRRVAGVE